MAELNPSEAINNRFYWGKIGVPAKILLIGLLVALALVATLWVKWLVLKIIIFIIIFLGTVYAVLVPLVILPKRRDENLLLLKEQLGGTIHEPEFRSRGFSSYVIWAGDYKGYPVEMEETFEGPLKKGVYHIIYRVRIELHKQFDIRRAMATAKDLNNPNYTSLLGVKFILQSRNNKDILIQWFTEDDRRLAQLVSICDLIGMGDLQGRWLSFGIRTSSITPVRRDFHPDHVKAVYDFLIEVGEQLRDAKIVKSQKPELGMSGIGGPGMGIVPRG